MTENAFKPLLVVHGGAILELENPAEYQEGWEEKYRGTLKESLEKGYDCLQKGGSSMEAVAESLVVIENSGLFDAGKGAVFTKTGKNEFDASIMNGSDLQAGAVACVSKIKNPILGAKMALEKGVNIIVAEGAHQFAQQNGLEMVEEGYFFNRLQWEDFEKIQKEEQKSKSKSTIGAVARDIQGDLAAGTSTGGLPYKVPGKLGDSPVLGAGTYADNQVGAVSCTGTGDIFVQVVASYDVLAQVKYGGIDLQTAAEKTLSKVKEKGGQGGLIAISSSGKITAIYNSPAMYRAWIGEDGKMEIKIREK